MSLHYLIDGYNLIKRNPQLAAKRLEDGRQALISYIEHNELQGSRRNEVTVVFDGKPGMYGHPATSYVRVVFTEYETADDLIKFQVQETKNRKSLIIVTDDKQLLLYVRALGAGVLSGGDFLRIKTSVTRHPSALDKKKSGNTKAITSTFEHLVNQELEQMWLSKKDKRSESK